MVLLESQQLGHNVFVTSYCTKLKGYLEDKHVEKNFERMFHHIIDLCTEFTRVNCKFPCPGNGAFLVNHMTRIIDCFVNRYKPTL